jgi:hypothetical protein
MDAILKEMLLTAPKMFSDRFCRGPEYGSSHGAVVDEDAPHCAGRESLACDVCQYIVQFHDNSPKVS